VFGAQNPTPRAGEGDREKKKSSAVWAPKERGSKALEMKRTEIEEGFETRKGKKRSKVGKRGNSTWGKIRKGRGGVTRGGAALKKKGYTLSGRLREGLYAKSQGRSR